MLRAAPTRRHDGGLSLLPLVAERRHGENTAVCKPALTGHPDLGTPSLCVSATSLQQPGALRKLLWLPPSQLRLWKEEGTRALHLCCVYQSAFPRACPAHATSAHGQNWANGHSYWQGSLEKQVFPWGLWLSKLRALLARDWGEGPLGGEEEPVWLRAVNLARGLWPLRKPWSHLCLG